MGDFLDNDDGPPATYGRGPHAHDRPWLSTELGNGGSRDVKLSPGRSALLGQKNASRAQKR
ncbi:hypothetical protein AMJ85_04360, partial [candidate division BRC1 bacterium SM23_51]